MFSILHSADQSHTLMLFKVIGIILQILKALSPRSVFAASSLSLRIYFLCDSTTCNKLSEPPVLPTMLYIPL